MAGYQYEKRSLLITIWASKGKEKDVTILFFFSSKYQSSK